MQKNEMIDYRNFRLSKLSTPEFRHLYYLLYWPLFGLLFYSLEQLWIRDHYFPMQCVLDAYIPFCECFLIPYLFWFVFLIGYLAYSLFFDKESFKQFMQFIMITYSATLLIYAIFPNCQLLRPQVFARDNVLTEFMRSYYSLDTNTNVCPSLHVIGSLAVLFSAGNSKRFQSAGWKLAFSITAILISVSTVFLKQHSVLDVLAALPVCLMAYILVFRKNALVAMVLGIKKIIKKEEKSFEHIK